VSVFGDGHVEVLVPQVQGDKLGDVRFVLDDQYAALLHEVSSI
jgi:hypothetical protein